FAPQKLYLKGDTVIVLGTKASGNKQFTSVAFVDVSSNATLRSTIELGGVLVDSRLIGNKLHLVQTLYLDIPYSRGLPDLTAFNLDPSSTLPDLRVRRGDGSEAAMKAVTWQDVSRRAEPDGTVMTAVVTVDIDDPEAQPASAAVMANQGTVYAS